MKASWRFPPFLAWVLLALIFALGLGVRLYRLDTPPLDYHPTRQLHSAIIARGMAAGQVAGLTPQQRQMAVTLQNTEGVIEPQVFERLVAFTYRLTGNLDLRIPRLYAIAFWTLAAVFTTWLAYRLTGWAGALVSGLLFMAWPYGVTASRAFLPEPLMLALIAACLWAADRWLVRHAWGWAIAAGLLGGLAIYVKSTALFIVGPGLAALVLADPRAPRAWRNPQVWVMAALAVLPYLAYLADGLWLHTYLVGQFSQRFFPSMWVDPAFYLRWLSNLARVMPVELLLVAALGALLLPRPYAAVVLAMLGGYVLYGLTLPHHISTHDYYHLPLFIPAALGLAAAAHAVIDRLGKPLWLSRLAVSVVLLAALGLNLYTARTQIKRSPAFDQRAALQEVSAVLPPGAAVAALTDDYGSALKYYAWINPSVWPASSDRTWQASQSNPQAFESLYQSLVAGKDYFVITDLADLEAQIDLKAYLQAHFPVLRRSPGLLIYDLRAQG